ncbi:MAG TPA: M20/M25/M40 family metallo-hydrolase, partial [Pyrinomonadaceae bacterium]|nr:M20/M25/M40 family metallo-hydrolase [Pyrinomonadaceae bacterium]
MGPQEVLKHFESRRDSIVRLIHQIVEIESPSFDMLRSKMVADWIVEKAGKIQLDIDIERVPVDGVGEHLLIKAFPGDGKHTLLLGHTDTVHPVGTRMKNPTRVEDDNFYGCGVFDMKANIVLVLDVLRYFAETGQRPSRPITILLSCDEEAGSKSG